MRRCWVVIRKACRLPDSSGFFKGIKKKAVVMTYTKREEHKMMHKFGTMCTHLDW